VIYEEVWMQAIKRPALSPNTRWLPCSSCCGILQWTTNQALSNLLRFTLNSADYRPRQQPLSTSVLPPGFAGVLRYAYSYFRTWDAVSSEWQNARSPTGCAYKRLQS
jgi:hypothetical protein